MSVYQERLGRVRSLASQSGIDLTVITHSTDFRYLTGYPYWCDERLLALVIPTAGDPFVIANQLYRLQVEPLDIETKLYWNDGDDPYAILKSHLLASGVAKVKKIALEQTANASVVLELQKLFQDSEFSLASTIIDPLRRVKDDREIKLLQEAANRSERALQATLARGRDWIGHTEKESSDELSRQLGLAGAPGGGLVAVGANAAQPHHTADDTVIADNELLLVDYGGEYGGYRSDETRTVFFGDPSDEFVKIYNIVREAQRLGIQAAKAGNKLEDVDIAARSYIADHGYGEYFTHRVGHGIGLDVHEGFSVNTGVRDRIVPGNVFSVEPGIYLPDRLGVRIESLVRIDDEGNAVLLHHLPTDLRIIK